jgi:uncharacterized protein
MSRTQNPAAPREPAPVDPRWPRYSRLPFPAYRFVPGRSPHPRRHPDGHSFGREEPSSPPVDPGAWNASELYRHAIDLYNFAYWWECHEALEALWHAAGPETRQGQFFQGLIQVAASQLKRFMGSEGAARALAVRGLERLARAPSPYMGVDVRSFERAVHDYIDGESSSPPLIALAGA